jgi:hypothetical protein
MVSLAVSRYVIGRWLAEHEGIKLENDRSKRKASGANKWIEGGTPIGKLSVQKACEEGGR